MSLNPEPSLPEERAQHNLSPKSYAAAAEQGLDESSSHDGSHAAGTPNGSIGRKHGEVVSDELEVYEKHEQANGDANGNGQGNGNGDGNGDENRNGDANGHRIKSAKPHSEYEKDTHHARRKEAELMSGRRAGAGWAKSKYVM